MNLVQLNDDCITRIMCSFEMCDVKICFNLAMTCKRFYGILGKNKAMIDEHFTHVYNDNEFYTYHYGDLIHRNDDLPAKEWFGCYQLWYSYGKWHRDNDLPAFINKHHVKQWYYRGKLHRDNDLPASEFGNGDKHWYIDGKLHRDNDLPAVIKFDGTKKWYYKGKKHRENDLPAVINYDGQKSWYNDGILYRSSFISRTGKENIITY